MAATLPAVFGGPATFCAALWRTRARPPALLSSDGAWASKVVATFARRTRQRHILARGKEDLQLRQFLEGMRGSWLAGRAQGWQPALSAVGWAVELSRNRDHSTGCEVAAEVLGGEQLPPELIEVDVLDFWLPRRAEVCRQWIRGGWGTRVTGT